MSIIAALILAAVVGITEILPVSGSGHLYLFAKLLGVPVSGRVFQSFRAMLCLGTAFGGILFYRTQLWDMLRENLVLLGLVRPAGRQRGEPFARRLGQLLFFATLPMIPALLLNGLRTRIEQGDGTLAFVCVLLCCSGAVLYFVSRGARGKRSIHQITLADALTAGAVQVLSVFPGLSRVALTLSALLGRGLDGPAAAEFAGLMGIPAFLGAGVVQLVTLPADGKAPASAPLLILAFALSALAGFFTLRFFTERMAERKPSGFAYWSWGAAILALILFLISA
ncbi:MAG: undecaprenyl-diphosphate phosphatase [Oscillospiraceae bacterium]|nr:undecaprenyl-diphosphate phosphatase [Oscillospiraceae bacterium]